MATQQIRGSTQIIEGVMDESVWNPDGLSPSQVLLRTATQTVTNKRISPRVLQTTSLNGTFSVSTDEFDCLSVTAQSVDISTVTSHLSGTPTNFQSLIVRIKDDGTPRAIDWGALFEPRGQALPSTTVASKILTVKFLYDTVTSKWGCVDSKQEA